MVTRTVAYKYLLWQSNMLMNRKRICVWVDASTEMLQELVPQLLIYTDTIFVVYEGTAKATPKFDAVHIISSVRGKGLEVAINKAAELGYDYLLVFPQGYEVNDIPKFLDKIEEKGGLLVGTRPHLDRTMDVRFASLLYWVQAGVWLPDVQCPFMAYPVQQLYRKYYRYDDDLELEILVRAAWQGIRVRKVALSEAGPRRSVVKRNVLLNIILLTITLFYIKPKYFLLYISKKDNWNKLWTKLFLTPGETIKLKATSISFGVFMGILPVWGFQFIIGMPLAMLFRLNKTLFFVALHISMLPITPVFWVASLLTGKLLLGQELIIHNWQHLSLTDMKSEGAAFFLGGTVLAIAGGVVSYLLSYSIMYFKKRANMNSAKKKSHTERYSSLQ